MYVGIWYRCIAVCVIGKVLNIGILYSPLYYLAM